MPLRLTPLLLALLLIGCPTSGTGSDDDDVGSTDCSDISAAQNPPEVELTAPPQSTIYSDGDTINFLGTATDEGTDPSDLEFEVLQMINVTPEDLGITIDAPASDGSLAFSLEAGDLGQGEHVIRLRATDPDGCQGADERFFCIDTADCVSN